MQLVSQKLHLLVEFKKQKTPFLTKRGFLYQNLIIRLGTLAQLVEQWTENPCVPGSIPGGTTKKTLVSISFTRVFNFNEI